MASVEPHGEGDRLVAALLGPVEGPSASERGPLRVTYAEGLQDGRTLSISPEIEALLGYTQVEWMAEPLIWKRLVHWEDRRWVVKACEEANRTGEPFRTEYRMIARDGRVVRIRDHAVLVRGSHGQPLCWQGVMVEVPQR